MNTNNENQHIYDLQQVTPESLKLCIDYLWNCVDNERLFCLAFEYFHWNITKDYNNFLSMSLGNEPWKAAYHNEDSDSEWRYPLEIEYKEEMLAHYNYWGNEIFSNDYFKIKKYPGLGLCTYLRRDKRSLSKARLAIHSKSFVEVLTLQQYETLKQLGHPSLWNNKGKRGVLFGWLTFFNHKEGAYPLTDVAEYDMAQDLAFNVHCHKIFCSREGRNIDVHEDEPVDIETYVENFANIEESSDLNSSYEESINEDDDNDANFHYLATKVTYPYYAVQIFYPPRQDIDPAIPFTTKDLQLFVD